MWAAVAAGPAFWSLLYWIDHPTSDLAWPLRSPAAFALLVVVYPVLEEVVFRGLIQGGLLARLPGRRVGPVSAANAVTSFLFAAVHLFYRHPLWAAGALVPSLVFGHFRERHGTVVTPIALHCWYNAGYFLLFR